MIGFSSIWNHESFLFVYGGYRMFIIRSKLRRYRKDKRRSSIFWKDMEGTYIFGESKVPRKCVKVSKPYFPV